MKKIIFKYLPLFISGAILTLAFAPFRLDFVAFISLAVLFYILNNSKSFKETFAISTTFGIGFFSTSISWVYISINLFTQSMAAGLIAAIALVILLSFLQLIPFGIFTYWLTNKSSKCVKLMSYPALWTLFEYVRGNLLWGGFPWASLGYSQTETSLIWYSNIGGVYLTTYITAMIATIVALCISSKNIKQSITSIFVIFFIFLGGHAINLNRPDITSEQQQNVALVQGDFIQGFKWDANNFLAMKAYYKKIAEKNKDTLIILAENALPTYRQNISNYLKQLNDITIKNHSAVIIGSLNIDKYNRIYNSSIVVGDGSGTYNKHHLVPFGEYFPISFFGYVDSVGLSIMSQGNAIQPVMTAFGKPFANFICYDVGYPDQVRNQLQGSEFISVISDDSWFGDSIARDQQLQISQVRAIENYRYLLATTSNGITAVIKPDGSIESELAKDTRGVLKAKIYYLTDETIWFKIGMSLIWILISIGVIVPLALNILKKIK